MTQKLILLAALGATGTLARYWLALFVYSVAGLAFPWGTLVVNALGCFLFGLTWGVTEERFAVSPETRVILLTGFMGSFTTFSTFAFETGQYLRDSQLGLAAANVLAQNGIGILFVFLGLGAARLL